MSVFGTIFDIKEFSIHDGPGARVTVFLKGCPLRCAWCHNPEGLSAAPQLMVKHRLCTHCGSCLLPCRHEECKAFGRCVHACPNGCLSVSGERICAESLAARVNKNADMVAAMGGGVTFSGGEPMMQADFVCETATLLPGLHKAIQTSGYAEFEVYKRVISHMDFVMQDIKLADSSEHMRYTGVGNEKILKNIEWLKESGKEILFRTPLIPGITDRNENLEKIAEITRGFKTEFLPYNTFAGAKYEMLGMEYPLREAARLEKKRPFGAI